MKKVLLSMAALSAFAVAAPAAAQYSNYSDFRYSPSQQLDRLQARLDNDVRRGVVPAGEALRLRDRIYELRRVGDRYRYGGVSGWERDDLNRRVAALRDEILATEDHPGYGRGSGYGDRNSNYDPNYDQTYRGPYVNGRYGGDYDNDGVANRYDRDDDNDGVADRYDRDDNDDGYDDRYEGGRAAAGPAPGAPYGTGPVSRDPGPGPYDAGPEGPLLRVGDRAPSNLGAVPPQLQNLYPDGNLVYYRYRDGAVYQIDRATNTIRWVGQIPY